MPNSIDSTGLRTQSGAARPIDVAAAVQPTVYVVRGRPGPLDRPALPSGHPESWGAITHGTLLDQAVYPFPIFWDLPQ